MKSWCRHQQLPTISDRFYCVTSTKRFTLSVFYMHFIVAFFIHLCWWALTSAVCDEY